MWQPERDSNPRPFGRKALNLPMSHHVPLAGFSVDVVNLFWQVITPFRNLILCTESRREMEEWMSAIRAAAANEFYDVSIQYWRVFDGQFSTLEYGYATAMLKNTLTY